MADPIAATRSLLNPADLAGMKQEGAVGAGTTVRDFLGKMGIDVDGPVEQLTKFANRQLGNATGLGKMNTIASMPRGGAGGAPGGGMGAAGMGGGMAPGGRGAPAPAGGMDGLLRNLG